MSELNFIASRLPGAPGALSAVAITGTVPDPPRNFAALDNGTILRGTVQGRDKDGLIAVKTDQGLLKIATNANLQPGSNVTLEVKSVGDRLQVIVLAVDQPAHLPDLPAGAPQGSKQAAPEDHDAQGANRQSTSVLGTTRTSDSTGVRQASSQPTVIVAGARLTAIVIQSVPRDLIQSSAATLQQADHEQAATTQPTASDPGKSGGGAAFTADFRPTPQPPISASLMPEIHARIAALFAEPVVGVEQIAEAALSAVSGSSLSPDIRERITALFVGASPTEPATGDPSQPIPSQTQSGNGATPPAPAQGQAAVPPASPSPGTVPSTGTVAVEGQPIPATPLPAPVPAQPVLPPPATPAAQNVSTTVVPPTPQVTTTLATAAASNPTPLPAPLPVPVPATPAPPFIEVPAPSAAPALPAVPGSTAVAGTQPPSPQPAQPPAAVVLPSPQGATPPATAAASNPTSLPPAPPPATPAPAVVSSSVPPLAAVPVPAEVPSAQPQLPQPAPPPAATAVPSNPSNQAAAGGPPPLSAPSVPLPATPAATPAPQLVPISPAILAQLLADAAEAGNADSVPWQVQVTPSPSPAPSGSVPQPAIPTSGSPLGVNSLQAATIANLLAIIEEGAVAALPLGPSAANSVPQDPAVSPSPIAPVSTTPLPFGPANATDGTAGQATAKPASSGAATPSTLAGTAAADTQIDPKAEGVALTAIVSSTGKVPLANAALDGANSGATTPNGTMASGAALSGTPAGGAALANAGTISPATTAAAVGEDTAGAINLGGKDQLSGPLPTGTELHLRVLNIQEQPAAMTSTGNAQINMAAATAGKATLVGQILGHTPAGHPVIHTSLGDLVLQQQASLPVGAKVTLALEAVEMATAGNLILPVTPQMTALNLAQGWPTLLDMLITLQHGLSSEGQPGATATGTDAGTLARLLQPGSKLAADMAAAVDAFRTGDFEKLFGSLTTALKAVGGKQESVRKLRDEFGQLSSLSQERTQQDWRCFFLPLWDDGRLQQINLFYRRPRRGKDDKDKGDEATRFIVEVNFTKLGGCQLDGLIRKKHFDLMIRSHQELPLVAKREIVGLFAEARDLGNYAGDVSFQTALRFPVAPLDDIAKDNPSVTA